MTDHDLGTATGKITVEYDGKGVDKAVKDTDRLERSTKKTSEGFQDVAQASAASAAVVAAGIAFAAKKAIDFEKQISAIGAVSGASAADLEALRKKALQLGADTAFSASEAAQAMEELAKAGISTKDILTGAADATVALAAAGGVALPQAAELAADAMNSFHLQASELSRVVDLIAGAANSSSISVGDFGQSLKQVGAVADIVGVSFGDAATAIALMGKFGIKGSDAGTSLKTMLLNLQPVTEAQKSAFRQLGLVTADGANKFFDAQGKIKGLAEISGTLKEALKNQTKQQKLATLELLFGQDAIRAAAILSEEGAEGFTAMSTAMGKVSAADVAKARLDNVAGSIEQLKGSAETAAIAFGTVMLPMIRKVSEFLTSLANRFTALNPTIQKVIVYVALAAAALLGIIAIIATAGAAVAGLAASVVALKIFAIIVGVIAIVAALAFAIKQAWDHSEGFRKAATAVFAVVRQAVLGAAEAVRALAAFFREKILPMIVETASTVKARLEPAFNSIAQFMTSRVMPALAELRAAFIAAWPTIQRVLTVAAQIITSTIKGIAAGLGLLIPIILRIAGPIFSALISAISFVIRNIGIFTSVFENIISIFKVIGAVIFAVVILPLIALWKTAVSVFNGVKSAAQGFISFLSAAWSVIGPPVVAVFNLIKTVIQTAMAVVGAIIAVAWTMIKATFDRAMSAIMFPVRLAFDAMRSIITTVLDFISPYITQSWNNIKTVVSAAVDFFAERVSVGFSRAKAIVEFVMDAVWSHISGTWDTIKAVFRSSINFIVTIADGISAFLNKVRNFFNQLKSAAEGGVGSLVSFVAGIPGRIIGAIGDLASLLYDKGQQIIEGLINGIKSMVGKVQGAVSSVVKGITDHLPGSPAKKGPLSGQGYALIRGEHLSEDFARGIEGQAATVAAAINSVVRQATRVIPNDLSLSVDHAVQPQAGRQAGAFSEIKPMPGPQTNVEANVYVTEAVEPEAVANRTASRILVALATGV